jgi:F420H(2)-dependent quinone reductase
VNRTLDPHVLCRDAVDVDRAMQRLNPAVAWLLRSPLHPLLDWGLMLVTVTGRRSGRVYTIPVGYQRQGDALVVLVSKPSRKQWWRNYRDRRPIGVRLRGRAALGHAVVVAPGSPALRDALEWTLRRVPGLGRQFGIAYDRRIGLTDAQLDVLAHAAVVVRIDLDAASHSPQERA